MLLFALDYDYLAFLSEKKDGEGILPNPNGPLWESIAPRIKRGKYAVYSPNDRARIWKYAAELKWFQLYNFCYFRANISFS